MTRFAEGFLFLSATLILLGLAVAMAYETGAIWSDRWPTISGITAGVTLGRPRLSIGLLAAACVLVGALAAHFFDWKPA